MTPRLRSLALLLTAGAFATSLGACISENNFADRYSETLCDKAAQCAKKDDLEFDKKSCISSSKDIYESVLDECDDYSGTLAHKCLKESEDQGCSASKIPDPCKDFNDKCGFEDFQGGYDLGLGAPPMSLVDADL